VPIASADNFLITDVVSCLCCQQIKIVNTAAMNRALMAQDPAHQIETRFQQSSLPGPACAIHSPGSRPPTITPPGINPPKGSAREKIRHPNRRSSDVPDHHVRQAAGGGPHPRLSQLFPETRPRSELQFLAGCSRRPAALTGRHRTPLMVPYEAAGFAKTQNPGKQKQKQTPTILHRQRGKMASPDFRKTQGPANTVSEA